MAKHYDVIVLGAGIGALSAAALLARRSWRVLVVGQGYRPATYVFEGHTLARRPFTFLAGSSPAWGRVLVELAQSQTFKRRGAALDPMFQVLAPRLRLDVPPDVNLFGKEIDREYPEVRRVVDELYAELARTNAAADAAFERDCVWPPGTFWERRETERVTSMLPHLHEAEGREFLAEFPRDHEYRAIVETPADFGSHVTALPAFAVARLHGAWTRGITRLPRGEDDLVEFLEGRVRAHGGDTKLSERVVRVTHKRGKVSGAIVDGDETTTGVQFVVADLTTRALLDLLPDFEPSRRTLSALPALVAAEHRYVVSMVVRNEALPAPLADEAFLLSTWPHKPGDARRPRVHLQCLREAGAPGTTLLVAEALFPEPANVAMAEAREVVMSLVQAFIPFVERHYLVVDSPHDGRPLWDYRDGVKREVDRAALRTLGGSLEAEPMVPRWRAEPRTFHGLAAEAVRSPLGNAFMVGRSAMPALGQEGELLAAWGAARMITRTDRRREKMRRDMWSKIELG